MNLSESIWERERHFSRVKELSIYSYRNLISFFIVEGLALTSLFAYLCQHIAMHWLMFIVIGLIIPIIGIVIAMKSDDWLVSLLGYHLLIIPFGIILGPTVVLFKTTVLLNAVFATLTITILMSLIGLTTKKDLSHWGIYLFMGLCTLLAVRIIQLFFPVTYPNDAWYWRFVDYGAALLFSMYIVYDWNRAMRIPRTLDNAVDVALAIYLDIINLFLTLLRILGRSKD
jgi:FtsH-binding integral membrane protein